MAVLRTLLFWHLMPVQSDSGNALSESPFFQSASVSGYPPDAPGCKPDAPAQSPDFQIHKQSFPNPVLPEVISV